MNRYGCRYCCVAYKQIISVQKDLIIMHARRIDWCIDNSNSNSNINTTTGSNNTTNDDKWWWWQRMEVRRHCLNCSKCLYCSRRSLTKRNNNDNVTATVATMTENGSNNNSDNNTCVDGSIAGGTRDTSTSNNNVRSLVGTYQTIAWQSF